jgi:hypothetical protein
VRAPPSIDLTVFSHTRYPPGFARPLSVLSLSASASSGFDGPAVRRSVSISIVVGLFIAVLRVLDAPELRCGVAALSPAFPAERGCSERDNPHGVDDGLLGWRSKRQLNRVERVASDTDRAIVLTKHRRNSALAQLVLGTNGAPRRACSPVTGLTPSAKWHPTPLTAIRKRRIGPLDANPPLETIWTGGVPSPSGQHDRCREQAADNGRDHIRQLAVNIHVTPIGCQPHISAAEPQ